MSIVDTAVETAPTNAQSRPSSAEFSLRRQTWRRCCRDFNRPIHSCSSHVSEESGSPLASLSASGRGWGRGLRFAFGAYLVARVAFSAWSLVIALLFPVVLQNLDLFGAPVLAVFDLASSERYVYSREMDGAMLTFRAGERGYVVDAQTGSNWSLRDGRAVSGKFVGRTLGASAYSIEEIFPYHGMAVEPNPLLALWQRFDTNWYLAIATRGYGTIVGDAHFPPLYPALIRCLGALGGNYLVAALIVSNLALIAALGVFYQTAREMGDAGAASRATAYLLLFPTAFFFFGAYTEPLFLFVALLALRTMQKGAWLRTGFLIFCAILIRLQGVALLVPLVYVVWRARPFDQKMARLVSLALPAIAIALYLLVRVAGGDPALIPTAEANLRARLAPPWENYFYALQTFASARFNLADVLNFLTTTLFVLALVFGWRRLPPAFALYAAASIIVLTMRLVEMQPLNSMSRYALTLFPIFVLLGVWSKSGWVQRAIVYPSFALALYLSAQFLMWGWVG